MRDNRNKISQSTKYIPGQLSANIKMLVAAQDENYFLIHLQDQLGYSAELPG